MTLKFKYSIGDKVLLVKLPSFDNMQYGSFHYSGDGESLLPKEYVVSGYGFDETGDGIKIYYRLYAYCDEIIRYDNRTPDELLEPSGENHPFEIESDILSGDGHIIKIGDSVFYALYDRYNGNDGTIPNTRFTFTGHGTVVSTHYFVESSCKPRTRIRYERDFLCTYCDDGKVREALDARGYSTIHTEPASMIDYGIRPGYAEAYAEEVSKKSNRWYLEHSKYEIEQWLKFLGVYDETMEAIDRWIEVRDSEKPTRPRKKPKKDDKELQEFVSSLTEEQREKLKKLHLL